MTKKDNNKIISVVHPICCGFDVHKNMVSACIIISAPDDEKSFVVKEFSTFTEANANQYTSFCQSAKIFLDIPPILYISCLKP